MGERLYVVKFARKKKKVARLKKRNILILKYTARYRGLVTTHLHPFLPKSITKLPESELRISVLVSICVSSKCNSLFYNALAYKSGPSCTARNLQLEFENRYQF